MSNIASLADEYGALKAQADAIETKLKLLRKEILATGYEEIVGERKIVKISLSERETLNAEAVRELLTEDQLRACIKKTLVESLRIKDKA